MSAPCLKCGTETDHQVEFSGRLDGSVFACDGCFSTAVSELDALRTEFEFMISNGVDRARANGILIARIDKDMADVA